METIEVMRTYEKEVRSIQIGDKILIPLTDLGEFTATAHKITDEGVLFIFDEYVTSKPMNKRDTNKGGYEKADLKRWIDTELFMAFPDWLRDRISELKKFEAYDNMAGEMKAIMDSFVRAGFTEDQAFEITLRMTISLLEER